jgi:hypothetical protein
MLPSPSVLLHANYGFRTGQNASRAAENPDKWRGLSFFEAVRAIAGLTLVDFLYGR